MKPSRFNPLGCSPIRGIRNSIPALALLFATNPVSATTFTWDGGNAGASWAFASNWNPDGTPTFNNVADIVMAGTAKPTSFLGANRTLRTITFDGTADANYQIRFGTAVTSGAANMVLDTNSGNARIIVASGAAGSWDVGGAGSGVTGNVVLNDNLRITHDGTGNLNITRPITESGGAKSVLLDGSQTTVFSAANTYTGNTTITGGTLALGAFGSVASSPQISVGASTTFDVSLAGGGFTLGASQTVSGSGTVVGAMAVSGTLSPGSSPGTLSTGDQTWLDGGDYNWQIPRAETTCCSTTPSSPNLVPPFSAAWACSPSFAAAAEPDSR